jgi:tetratricopeptide (TPR) repeat protein
MRFGRGAIIAALGAALIVGACAPATPVATGPVLSPTGEPYPPGIAPRDTRQSNAAQLFLAQAAAMTGEQAEQMYRRALDMALEGMQTDTTNAVYYFIAAQAHAGLGDYEAADRLFRRAEEIYPAYELEIDPAREQAWAMAFNRGIEAYQAGDLATAERAWLQANQIYDRRPEAFLNLAIVRTQGENYDGAAEAYRGALDAIERRPARALTEEEVQERAETRAVVLENYSQLLVFRERFAEAERLYREILERTPGDVAAQSMLAMVLARQDRQDEARQIYDRLLAAPDLQPGDLFSVGVGLFNAQDYARAAEAFRRVTDLQPHNRDAWYNYLNALYAQEAHADLIPVGQRVLEIDPLNVNVYRIMAQAYRQTRQSPRALDMLERAEALPVYVTDIQFRPGEQRTVLRGMIEGKQAAAGSPVQLEFTFFGPEGAIGTRTVTVNAPAAGATANFEVVHDGAPATGYRYRLVR